MRPGRWLGRRLPVDRHLKAVPREAWGSGSSGSSGSSGGGLAMRGGLLRPGAGGGAAVEAYPDG
ncbi:hypothetical protein GCM10010344_15680 [Streptomyces bluensis]|nr:hypothetical protein GCM10010344_15680 [Streptomyces bluensis]